jgi:hypothetical protein
MLRTISTPGVRLIETRTGRVSEPRRTIDSELFGWTLDHWRGTTSKRRGARIALMGGPASADQTRPPCPAESDRGEHGTPRPRPPARSRYRTTRAGVRCTPGETDDFTCVGGDGGHAVGRRSDDHAERRAWSACGMQHRVVRRPPGHAIEPAISGQGCRSSAARLGMICTVRARWGSDLAS